jgi:phosphoglycerate dehydrogenase-like enzyme
MATESHPTRPVIVNQLGARVTERVSAEFPFARVLETEPGTGIPPGSGADVVLVYSARRPELAILCEPGVRWIHLLGAGADGLPAELFADGRRVTSSKGASSVPISEFVLASILAIEKRFPLTWIDRPLAETAGAPPGYGPDERTFYWEPPFALRATRFGVLPGKTLGLVGFGGIGSAIAVRARAFGMNILALRRRPALGGEGVELARDIEELVARSDHLVLAAPLTGRTRHILDRAALSHAKPSLHVVNISRGGLIDQEALLEALDEGRIAFASLDVTDPEPLPEGHRLYSHPRVHLSPHVSWSRPDSLAAPVDLFIENLGRYVAGRDLVGVVDPAEGY